MPLTGTLRSWNEERGFGFIAPTHGGAEIFVHVTAFTPDGTKPTVGEKLSYELGRGRDGKPQAVEVVRLAVGSDRRPGFAGNITPKPQTNWLGMVALFAVLLIASSWGYKRYSEGQHRRELAAQPTLPAVRAPTRAIAPATFGCDGRTYCSQMTSCAEAKWFINHCPGTKMDGNNDGIPCQEQWCN